MVKVINIISGVLGKRCVFINEFDICYRFNIKWSIIYTHLRITTQMEKVSRDSASSSSSWNRLTLFNDLQTFKSFHVHIG